MGRKLPNGASCADLALPSPGGTRIVSRVHAHFKHTPEDGWSITDNKSVNGIAINKVKIVANSAARLVHGDIVYVGVASGAEVCTPCDPGLEFRFTEEEADPVEQVPEPLLPPPENVEPRIDKIHYDKMQTLVSQLIRDTECSICFENQVHPVQLAECPHTFCKTCIHNHLSTVELTCPQCRQVVKGEPGDNLAVQSLIDTLTDSFTAEERADRNALVAKRTAAEMTLSFDFIAPTRKVKKARRTHGAIALPPDFQASFGIGGSASGATVAHSRFAPTRESGTSEDPVVLD